jgi:putative dimethyl sulfoxide reductase chaperone
MDMPNETMLDLQEMAEAARARAAFSSFLSLHFNILPDQAFAERLRSGDVKKVLQTLISDANSTDEFVEGARLMNSYLERMNAENPEKLSENLGVDRTRLYRGIAQGYGPPPPYELVWSRSTPGVELLQGLSHTYHEMGLVLSPEAKERPDYIGIELDFIHELAQQEAAAWESNQSEIAVILLAAQRSFMHDHLGQWAPYFIDKAMEQVGTDFYRGHLLMLRSFISSVQEDLSEFMQLAKA